MEARDSVGAIEELDSRLSSIFRGFKLVPGSVCRVASQYLPNWGVIVNEETRDEIERRSLASYLEEWRQSDPTYHRAINVATTRAGIRFNNHNLNETLGAKAASIIETIAQGRQKRGTFRILDVGAGDGATTLAVLNVMKATGTERSVVASLCFDLLDASEDALYEAKKRVEQRANIGGTFATTIQNYLQRTPDGFYDMVISNAALHHMAFPDYLSDLNRKLGPEGVMVIGDWHTTIWSQPAFVLPILNALGANYGRVRAFETLFNIKKGDYERLQRALPDDEKESNLMMLRYEERLAEELNGAGGRALLYMLEAHESLPDRLANYRKAGFETDMEELQRKHKGFCKQTRNINRLRGKDLATVVAMGKIDSDQRRGETDNRNGDTDSFQRIQRDSHSARQRAEHHRGGVASGSCSEIIERHGGSVRHGTRPERAVDRPAERLVR